jgi:polyisoprenoid-binding protein YceI
MQAPSGQLTASLQALLEDRALAGAWVLDPGQSSIRLKNRSASGLIRVNGVFREVSGNGTVTVTAASIDTGNTRRDTHLRSADFFDSDHHPHITFTADAIRPTGQGATVTSALTVRDRTRPLSFDAMASVRGTGEIWLDAEVHINRAEFGLTWNLLGLLSMENTLNIHTVFTRR